MDRGQRREPDAVGKAACHLGGSADGQPRLAHPATARQRQQARGRQQPLDFMQLVAPPDEAGRLDRQFRSPSLRGGGLHARPPYTPADLLGSGSSNAGSMLRNGASDDFVHRPNEFKADAGEEGKQAPLTRHERRPQIADPFAASLEPADGLAQCVLDHHQPALGHARQPALHEEEAHLVSGRLCPRRVAGTVGSRVFSGLVSMRSSLETGSGFADRQRHVGKYLFLVWRCEARTLEPRILDPKLGTNLRVGSDVGHAVPSQSAGVAHQRTAVEGART